MMAADWLKRIYRIGWSTYQAWREDRTIRLGAGLAYYTLFTVVPFFALLAVLAEQLIGRVDVERYLQERLEGLELSDAEALAVPIAEAIGDRSIQSSVGVIGMASLLVAASLVFLALGDAINTIWDAPVDSGFWGSLRRRFVAFIMVLATIAVVLFEFAVAAITGAAGAIMPGELVILEDLAELLTHSASWVALAAALALLNRFVGPVRVPWRVALFSGLVTAVALVVGTWAIGLYLKTFGGGSVAGAFTALLAFLTWVYIEAQILLIGVQLTKTLTLDPDREAGS